MRYHPKTEPFAHQTKATLAAVRHRNYAVFAEPRLGKSKIALDYVAILALKGEVRRVLIVAPRIAVNVWQRELNKHFPYPCYVETFEEEWQLIDKVYEGSPPEVKFFLAGREETFRAVRTTHGRLLRPKQKELERWKPDVIIFDESHQYKRPGGRGAQDAWRFVARLRRGYSPKPYVLLLSGTPNPKGWRDLFAQYRIMDETIFGTSASSFDEDYVIYGKGKRRYTILRYKRERAIMKKVRNHSIAISAEEAGLAGKRSWSPVYVDLPAAAMTAYEKMVEEYLLEVEGELITAKNLGVLRLRLLQITGGFTTSGKQYHSSKVEAVRDYLRLLHEQGEPFIVGARFLPEVEAVAGSVPRDCNVGVVTGATRQSRDEMVDLFQRGRLDGLVFQVQAGSAAIELSRAAEVIFYSLPDGWIDFKQFSDRVLGPNQKRPVRYTPILARHTLDRNVLVGLRRKESWHNELMNNPRSFLSG